MEDPYLNLFHEVHRLIRSANTSLSDLDLTSTEESSTTASRHRSEHFRRLFDAFTFSRSFIVTYQGAIVLIVLLATVWRWQQRRSRSWRKTRRRERGGKRHEGIVGGICNKVEIEETGERTASVVTEVYKVQYGPQPQRREEASNSCSSGSTRGSSSSSSTSNGNVTPPTRAVKEEEHIGVLTPLLAPKARTTSVRFIPWSWLRATLIYQPPPLPLLHRIIPSNSTTLTVLLLLGLNLFYLFYNIDFTYVSCLDIISDRAGLLFVANIPWLYLLAAKNQPLKKLTGDSYENLNLYHRRQGEWMCLLAVIHFGGMLCAWYNFLRPEPFNYSLCDFLTIRYILWGVGAWTAYEVLYVTSLSSFREWCYELFLASHIALQILGLGMLWMHHFRCGPYVVIAMVIFIVDRTAWRIGLKSFNVRADLQVMEDGETVKVSANWPVKSSAGLSGVAKRFFGRDMRYGWRSSQHVFLTVPGIGRTHRM